MTYFNFRDIKRSARRQGLIKVISSKARSRALSIGADVNKLTTLRETKISFSDIVKF